MSLIIIKLENKESLKIAAAILNKGGTIIFPTDTIYGIGALATAAGAKKIGKIKNRADNKPFPLLVSSLAMAEKFALINPQQKKFLKKNWPGAVTAILSAKRKIAGISTNGKIGLRQPNHSWLLKLIKKCGQPLIGTSANPSGQPGTNKIRKILDYFDSPDRSVGATEPDLIIDASNLPSQKPSTVIDLTIDPPQILR
ncbi:MAG: L-threonylcarbamoyladenylate synthase [bacterium]|nr:L-threonylcarbamoyladenylate synthase [bacterium]